MHDQDDPMNRMATAMSRAAHAADPNARAHDYILAALACIVQELHSHDLEPAAHTAHALAYVQTLATALGLTVTLRQSSAHGGSDVAS